MRFKTRAILFFLGMIATGIYSITGGAEIKSGQNVDFKGDVKQDLYAGAGTITIAGNVTGDVNLAGGDITFKGKVTQDVQMAGGKIHSEITGADDIRIMGGEAYITVKNSGDVFLMGGQTNIAAESDIAGDLYIMGGKVVSEGRIRGNVYAWGGDVQLKGVIEGNLDLRAETSTVSAAVKGKSRLSSTMLTIQPDARFTGSVEYWSKDKVNFHDSVKGGSARFDDSLRGQRDKYNWGKHWIWFALWFPASAALTIFLVLFFMPNLVRQSSERVLSAPVSALGYGVLFDITLVVITFLLFLSVIGVAHALFLCALYAFGIVFARPVTSAILTAALAKKFQKKWSTGIQVIVGLGIYTGLSLLFMFPVIGFLLNLLAIWIVTGAIVQVFYERNRAAKV